MEFVRRLCGPKVLVSLNPHAEPSRFHQHRVEQSTLAKSGEVSYKTMTGVICKYGAWLSYKNLYFETQKKPRYMIRTLITGKEYIVDLTHLRSFDFDPNFITPLNIAVKDTNEHIVQLRWSLVTTSSISTTRNGCYNSSLRRRHQTKHGKLRDT